MEHNIIEFPNARTYFISYTLSNGVFHYGYVETNQRLDTHQEYFETFTTAEEAIERAALLGYTITFD